MATLDDIQKQLEENNNLLRQVIVLMMKESAQGSMSIGTDSQGGSVKDYMDFSMPLEKIEDEIDKFMKARDYLIRVFKEQQEKYGYKG